VFLASYIGLLHQSEQDLAEGFHRVADGHANHADVYHTCRVLAKQCDAHVEALGPFAERYGEQKDEEPERLYHDLLGETREGSFGLLRDLQDLYMMANFSDITWTMVGQAAQGVRDRELLETVESCEGQTTTQVKWLKTKMKQAAPQTLIVASS
jgi:hypothetical protein